MSTLTDSHTDTHFAFISIDKDHMRRFIEFLHLGGLYFPASQAKQPDPEEKSCPGDLAFAESFNETFK